jgi:hypothetical protein
MYTCGVSTKVLPCRSGQIVRMLYQWINTLLNLHTFTPYFKPLYSMFLVDIVSTVICY